jgi:hypothetical protein
LLFAQPADSGNRRGAVSDSKGSAAILPDMNTNRRHPADRDRAVARLRRLTLGSAAGGVIGTMLFGGLAAATYDGTTATTTAAATTDDSAAQIAADDSTSNTSGSTSTSDNSTTVQATQAPTATSTTGGAHASTGGS